MNFVMSKGDYGLPEIRGLGVSLLINMFQCILLRGLAYVCFVLILLGSQRRIGSSRFQSNYIF